MSRTWPLAGVGFAVIWVFVRGVTLTPAGVLGQFLFGLAIGLPVASLFRRLYAEEIRLRRSLRIVPAVLRYVTSFLFQVLVANLDVAYRVLAPHTPIDPQVIRVPLRVETSLGVTTIANSVTLTPGTVTLDHDPEDNAIYVHLIDGRDPAEAVRPIRAWEDQALVIFDESNSPGDPAPEFTVHPPESELPTAPAADADGPGHEGQGDGEREGQGQEANEVQSEEAHESDRHGGDGNGD